MKLPNRLIIDLEDSRVLLEHATTVTVCEEVSKLSYCQNSSEESIELSINITIPFEKVHKEGVEEEELERVISHATDNLDGQLKLNLDDSLVQFVKGLVNEHQYEEDYTDDVNHEEMIFTQIEASFNEMVNNPEDEQKATEFIDYTIDGYEPGIFEFKKSLFKEALKDASSLNSKQREWLKKVKIRLLNSRKKLGI